MSPALSQSQKSPGVADQPARQSSGGRDQGVPGEAGDSPAGGHGQQTDTDSHQHRENEDERFLFRTLFLVSGHSGFPVGETGVQVRREERVSASV